MKIVYQLIACLFITTLVVGQKEQPIKITSERNENIIKMYAENSGNEAYKIELIINSKGFKHTRECPIIETVPPGVKLYLTSLIAKKEEAAEYSINLKYAPTHPSGKRQIDSDVSDIDLSEGIFVFSKQGCGRCKAVEKYMIDNDIEFTKLDISKNSGDAALMWKQLWDSGFSGNEVNTPVIVVNGDIHYNLNDYNKLLKKIAADN